MDAFDFLVDGDAEYRFTELTDLAPYDSETGRRNVLPAMTRVEPIILPNDQSPCTPVRL